SELSTLTVTNTASDADLPANILTFSLLSGPPGVHLDSATGLLTWTPTEAQGPDPKLTPVHFTHNGTPVLHDTSFFTIVLTEPNTSTPPLHDALPIFSELSTLTVTNTASDADLPANTLTFSLLSGPPGMYLNSATGLLTWTPTEAQG